MTDKQIAAFEIALGGTLPEDLRALYRDHLDGEHRFLADMRLLSVEEVMDFYEATRTWPDDFGIRYFWYDENSNYAGVYLHGPLTGRVCLLAHDSDIDQTPRWRSVGDFMAFLAAEEAVGHSWYEQPPGEDATGVRVSTPEEDTEDWACAEVLLPVFLGAEEGARIHYASCIMALTPYDRSETLLQFLDDLDFFIPERACLLLGRRRYEPAIDALAQVAEFGIGNAYGAAIGALVRIGTPACWAHLKRLAEELPPDQHGNYRRSSVRRALEKAGH